MRIPLERIAPPIANAPEALRPTREDAGAGAAFASHLASSLETVEAAAQRADEDAEGMVAGTVDLHTAMISMEKADIMLKVGATVRNKLLDAYRQLTQLG